jgi:hippurate hydrolase
VAVIFQPAEENGGGGREMIEDGMMERFNIQEVYGMHNWPGLPPGQFAIRSGPFFAATDLFSIDVTGRGGHAANPHETIDATVVAAHLVTALQSIASRNVDPVREIVVSVTSFRTDTDAHNVIPDKVSLKGTVRTLDAAVRDLAQARMMTIAEGVALAFGAVVNVDYRRNYPAMINARCETGFAADAARKVAGHCAEAPLVMWGEDFAFMLQERPGAYILIGNGDSAMVHSSDYDFCDDAIPAGCSWWVEVVETRMPAG